MSEFYSENQISSIRALLITLKEFLGYVIQGAHKGSLTFGLHDRVPVNQMQSCSRVKYIVIEPDENLALPSATANQQQDFMKILHCDWLP